MNPVTWNGMGRGWGILLPLSLIFFLTVGCGPSKMAKDQLEKARKTYEQAKADPDVPKLAPIQLADAESAVRVAEQTGNSDEMIHLSYLAERKARIAMTVAAGKKAEENIEKLNTETADLLAKKMKLDQQRELEAEKAKMDAERARLARQAEEQKAAQAKMEAEKARMEAEQARLTAKLAAEKAARASADADKLMRELSELQAKQTERGIVLTIGEVLFAFGRADLSTEANRNVDKLATFLKKYPTRNLLIEGHTDSVGTDEYNLELSRKRSESVKERLVGFGIDPGRITAVGYGEKYPAVSNDTEANRAQNRRVEVIILNEGVKAETQLRE